jgi:putative spermidine/putrescine transport system ATP-binding protein
LVLEGEFVLVSEQVRASLGNGADKKKNGASPPEALISLRNLAKAYKTAAGEFPALRGIDADFHAGEFVGILGKSGAGKSTLVNMISAVDHPTGGEIWVNGVAVHRLNENQASLWRGRNLGVVFQSFQLMPSLTLLDNVMLAMDFCGLYRGRRSVDYAMQLLHQVELEDHAYKLPSLISGGQQQRVAIARAIVLEPSLVLMDEPLSNLDANLRMEMRTEIRRLHQSLGLTTVYVTHDQEEALSLADRLVLLRAGRVQQIGTPQQLYDRPVNWHVADFMGYRNILPMRVTAERGPDSDELVVEGSGLRLRGTPIGEIVPGEPAMAAVRPDDLRLTTPDDPHGLSARVEVVEYSGRDSLVEVSVGAGLRLRLRTTDRPAPATTVTVTVDPSRLLVFPAGKPRVGMVAS